ncbi:kinase-like domain protein [Rutstroemia sp. NJR-2017a BBW]|nr:kinase-like domain protein [Rutstroemia sp. NJR-2017a BBW]
MSNSKDYELWCGLADERLTENPDDYINGRLLYVKPDTTIGRKDHKFEIIAKLGYGGSSVVWLARKKNASVGGWCAIKILAAGKSSVEGELAAVERIKSCGVEVVGCERKSDAWTEERNDRKYLCLKMGLSGPSVKECLRRKLTPELRLSLAIQATDIMSKLHKKKEFLYDFSSSNLLVKLKPKVNDQLMMQIIKENTESEDVDITVDRKGTSLLKHPNFPRTLYAPITLRDIVDDSLPLQLIDFNDVTPS